MKVKKDCDGLVRTSGANAAPVFGGAVIRYSSILACICVCVEYRRAADRSESRRIGWCLTSSKRV